MTLKVENLSLGYGAELLFCGVSFTLQRGEHCSLVGRNGTGKSTLLRLLSGQEHADSGHITMPKGYKLGFLQQHIDFSQTTLLAEAMLGLPSSQRECRYLAERVLSGLGFSIGELEKPPKEFSGGYQLRLHLAKVLLSDPDCLLLDEPTNYLDIVSLRWLRRFLQEWPGEFILISHDREFLDSVSTHTMGIHRKQVRKIAGSTDDYFMQILQDEEVYEKTRVNIERKKVHAEKFIERFGAKATKAAQAASRQKMVARLPTLEKLKDLYNLDFQFNTAPFFGRKMAEMAAVSFSYQPAMPLISQLSLTLERGERLAIVGKNGRGKSTILRLLAQDLSPQGGDITYGDNVLVGYFGQTNVDRLNPTLTVEEEIATANASLGYTAIRGICGLMMFNGDSAKKPVNVLSGGERSRVLLGKIIAKPCNLLLLDEPTHHLDIESIEALIDALEDFSGGIVLVTHSELILQRLLFDKILVCHHARQELFLGDYAAFLEKDGWHDNTEAATQPQPRKKGADAAADRLARRPPNDKAKKSQIMRCEADITATEVAQAQDNQALMHAIEQGDKAAIHNLGLKIAQRDVLLSELYTLLEKLSDL